LYQQNGNNNGNSISADDLNEVSYDGINYTKNIFWRYETSFLPTLKPETGIKRTEYNLTQSDFIVILDCHDSSLIATFPIKIPHSCLMHYQLNTSQMDKDSLSKIYFFCWQEYYNIPLNKARIDTIYIQEKTNSIIFDPTMYASQEQLFFETREIISKPNSGDSTVIEFYNLDEVNSECQTGYYFRRKSLKMYKDGMPHGIWISYNLQGTMVRRIEYNIGVISKDERF
jgi:hypothetical protein